MKLILVLLFASCTLATVAQSKRTKVPSYFGFQIRPVFPTRFIGEPELTLSTEAGDSVNVSTTLSQKIGYSFGGTVRAGVTKLIAIETGINFTQRHFDSKMSIPDSNIYGSNDLTFISYDIPVNVLFYIRLAEKWYMNASLGVAMSYSPTDVGTYTAPNGPHEFRHYGLVRKKVNFDLNANVGFEFRTEKSGFFYLGGSGRVPFAPIFDLLFEYTNEGFSRTIVGEVDGSFLSIDFKYFFPVIKNKGAQFKPGPITH